jgi:hypothetical protein
MTAFTAYFNFPFLTLVCSKGYGQRVLCDEDGFLSDRMTILQKDKSFRQRDCQHETALRSIFETEDLEIQHCLTGRNMAKQL